MKKLTLNLFLASLGTIVLAMLLSKGVGSRPHKPVSSAKSTEIVLTKQASTLSHIAVKVDNLGSKVLLMLHDRDDISVQYLKYQDEKDIITEYHDNTLALDFTQVEHDDSEFIVRLPRRDWQMTLPPVMMPYGHKFRVKNQGDEVNLSITGMCAKLTGDFAQVTIKQSRYATEHACIVTRIIFRHIKRLH